MKKTILNLRKQCPRRRAALAALGLFAITAQAQVITWTSSHPDIVSVDENTGAVEMISEPATTTNVTITATTQQNGKTLTSVKTVQVDSCTACFTFNSLNYCGVKLSNGQCWLDRDLGATALNGVGAGINQNEAPASCPAGWRLPYTDEFVAMARIQTGNSNITATVDRNVVSAASMGAAPMKFAASCVKWSDCNHIWQQEVSGNRMHCNWGCRSSSSFCKNNETSGLSVRCIKG